MGSEIGTPPAHERPSGRMQLSADQSDLADFTWVQILLDTVTPNWLDGIEDTGNNQIEPVLPGFYHIAGMVHFKNTIALKKHQARITAGGVTMIEADNRSSSTECIVNLSTVVWLAANSVLKLFGWHNAGVGTVDVEGGFPSTTHLIVQRVR